MTEQGEKDFLSVVSSVMNDCQARGIAVGIVKKNGEVAYERYFGYRDEEKRLPINKDTVFGLASVTKSFTALSIMQMEADGILSICDPISKYIPEFTNKNQEYPVKIWHLLTHTGGFFPLPRIVVDKTLKEMGIEDSLDNEIIYRKDFADEGIRRVASRLDSQTRFTGRRGERHSYCNDGFGLLSDIVRRHSGYGSFASYLEKRILSPLGMTRSNISFIRNTLDDNAAVLYSLEEGNWRADKDYQNDAFVLHGGGAMKSTLSDMMKYGLMYLNEGLSISGERIIDRYHIGEMIKPRVSVKPGVYYGYGLESRMLGDMTIVEHSGSLPGVSSYFMFSPQAEVATIVLCNTMDVSVGAVANAAMRFYLDLPVESPRPEHKMRFWSEEELKELDGRYVSGEGDCFSLKNEDGTLKMELNGKPCDLECVYPWQGMIRRKYGDAYVTAFRDDDGHVFAAQYGSRIFPKEEC